MVEVRQRRRLLLTLCAIVAAFALIAFIVLHDRERAASSTAIALQDHADPSPAARASDPFTRPEIEFDGRTLRGRVIDEASAEGIAGALVCMGVRGIPLPHRAIGCVQTDADGRFEMSVPPAAIRLAIVASEHLAQMHEFDGRAPQDITFSLARAPDFIVGNVADVYGGPISGAWVYVTDAAGRRLDGAAQSGDEGGEFAVGFPRGHAANQGRKLCAGARGYADECVVLLAPDRRHRLTLGAGGTIGGKVVDGSNRPLAGARVEARPLAGLAIKSYMPEARTWATITNTEGEFQLADVPHQMLRVEAEHMMGRAQAFTELAPGETDYLVLQVHPGAPVEGRVLAAGSGRACSNAEVVLRAVVMQAVRFTTLADEEGHYRFDVVAPGEYEANVECDTMVPKHGVPISVGSEPSVVDFRLDQGVSVCVALEPASPLSEEIQVAIYGVNRESRPRYREAVLALGVSEHCFYGLSPGGYVIGASTLSGSQGSGRVEVQLAAEDSQQITIPMQGRGQISGRLACGKSDARVVAQRVGGGYFESNWSDRSGQFTLGPISPGRYSVRVDDDWFAPFDPAIDPETIVDVSTDTVDVEIACPDPGSTYTLRGEVIEADGTPVDNVAVSLWVLQGGETRSVYTNYDGRFEFEGVSTRAQLKLYAEAGDGRHTPRTRVSHDLEDPEGEHVLQFPAHGRLHIRGGKLGESAVLVEVITPGHFRRALALDQGEMVSVEVVPAEPATTVYSYFLDGSSSERTIEIQAGSTTEMVISLPGG